MPGLALPHKIINGRLQLEDGEDQLLKVIMIAAGARENQNPWNKAGIETDPFLLNDPTTRAKINRGLEEHFSRLERAGRASKKSIRFRQEESTLWVDVVYLDLVRGVQASKSFPIVQALGA